MTTLQIYWPAGIGAGHRGRAGTNRRPATACWPSSTGLLAAYGASAMVTAGAVIAGGTRHPALALAALAVTVFLIAARTRLITALAVAGISWMFDDGFITGRDAQLSWHGAADGWRLAVLAGAALAGVLLARWVAREPAKPPAAPAKPPAPPVPFPAPAARVPAPRIPQAASASGMSLTRPRNHRAA